MLSSCRWPAISLPLAESAGCGLFGGESAVSRPVTNANFNGTTAANSDEWTCAGCGERAAREHITESGGFKGADDE